MDESSAIKCSLVAHHGTSKEAKTKILTSCHFNKSNTDSEWAGTGIYFFIDYTSNTISKNNAIQWATEIKNIPTREVAIIEAKVEYDENEVFNVRTDEARKLFHRYRNEAFRVAVNAVDKYNAALPSGVPKKQLSSTYTNERKFDCFVFNELCKEYAIKAVIRDAYINFYHNKYSVYFIYSDIPNCTLLCVKDDSILKELK